MSRLWTWWSHGAATGMIARTALSGAGALLFLSAAGTFEIGFTVTPSYVLAAAAAAAGGPRAARGWLRLPRFAWCAALVLIAVYGVGVLVGTDAALASQAGRSGRRDAVYFADLLLGLSVVGLSVDVLRTPAAVRSFAATMAVGGVVAAAYAIYQWPAQHFGLAFDDITNAVNSDGVTRGARNQGAGLLGWERVRGTFKEPLFLASLMTLVIPLCVGLGVTATTARRRRAWFAGTTAGLAALLLTVSSLAWAALALVALGVAAGATVVMGRTQAAAAAGVLLTGAVLAAPALLLRPQLLAPLTGRAPAALVATSKNRTDAWHGALDVWSTRPLFGYGPGQSAVQLAYRPSVAPGEPAPEVLGSAQGLWTASLVDAGVIGLLAWLALFGALAVAVGSALVRTPEPLLVAAAAGASCVAILSGVSADRLDLRMWFALGLVAAAATARQGREDDPA